MKNQDNNQVNEAKLMAAPRNRRQDNDMFGEVQLPQQVASTNNRHHPMEVALRKSPQITFGQQRATGKWGTSPPNVRIG